MQRAEADAGSLQLHLLLFLNGLIQWHAELLVQSTAARLIFVQNFAGERRDGLCMLAGHNNDTIAVGHDHVTGTDQHTADGYGFVDRLDFVASGPYAAPTVQIDRKSTRLNSSHVKSSYAV